MTYSMLYELLLFPLDTLKTRFYCDTAGHYKGYADLINKTALKDIFRGLEYKLVHNLFFLMHLRNI